MAVTRSKLGFEQDEPARQHLGRILVTIDDLKALVDVLVAQGQSPGEIRIGFDGGEIDEPEDLRSLTDEELLRLTVRTPKIEIVLDAVQAVAIGDAQLASAVEIWARRRQHMGRAPGPSLGNRLLKKWWLPSVMSPSIAITVWLAIRDGLSTGFTWVVIGAQLLSIALILRVAALGAPPVSYAVIEPRTRDEVRKDSLAWKRHRTSIIMTAIGIVSAMAGVVVGKLLD